ncbi:MAG: AAA family ATPase, partial [Candidatus Omnitrophica bacterium]|nr:AAA family ATPase [Candidatus Omnitrophota bacterium]
MYLALQVRALGKSLIFVGKQGTGKSVLAETVGILLDGEEVPQIEIKKDTDKEELTFKPYLRGAISGFDYGPYAVGVRDHKTVISEETTQGQPGVIGVSNEVIERQFIVHPDGTKIGKEGDGRFGVIHAINPPGNTRFLVKAFSDEYIERHATLWFETSSPEEMYNYLLPVSERKGIRVNPRIIGEKLRNAAGEVVLVNGQEKWIGLVGMVQDLLIKEEINPLDKKLPLRIPGYRALKSLIKDMRSYWEVNAAFSKDERQELLLDKFLDNFVMEGSPEERARWINTIKGAFKESNLWAEDKDAVIEYLGGEGMLVQKLPLLREPDIKEKDFHAYQVLIYLQENTKGKSVEQKIEELEGILGEHKKGWEELSFREKLEKMYIMRVTWQILELIGEHRKGDNYDSHTDINIDRMRAVQDTVQSHVLDEYWPRSFIEREEETWKELESRIEDMVFTDDLKLDDVLGKIGVNIGDTEYVEAQVEKLKEKIKGYKDILEDSTIDELEKIAESIVLERVMDLLKEVFKKNENKEPKSDMQNIEELGDEIGDFLDEYMWL